jgi:group I intron endonuclease
MSGRSHSEESKQKMSDAKKGENHPNYGKPRENHPMFGKTHSEQSKLQNLLSQPNSQQIEVTDVQTNQKTNYNSIREAARALNIRQSNITLYFSRNQVKPYKDRYIFKKVD